MLCCVDRFVKTHKPSIFSIIQGSLDRCKRRIFKWVTFLFNNKYHINNIGKFVLIIPIEIFGFAFFFGRIKGFKFLKIKKYYIIIMSIIK